ncbi:hypothetical protein [Pseudomonas sp. Q2-TVG4-2]|uniref:hypothetical protein n=1 Tax=Pseudomonas sp. Q2-TVG4-2 TaxID=1685699 RepID=UPI0015E6DB69|nr:hypothetical protein [Pseudomonas sp. Q2-TVG4-2]
MSGPFVRVGQLGNASLTSAANNQSNLLFGGAGHWVAPALFAQHRVTTPFVIWNLQVL